MDTNKNRARGKDQLCTRIGSAYLADFNAYIKKNGLKKVQFIRDALSYWMSVNGDPSVMQQNLEKTQLEFQLAKREIEYLSQLVNEKERMILSLQDQIQRLDNTRSSHLIVNGNQNQHIIAMTERRHSDECMRQKEDDCD